MEYIALLRGINISGKNKISMSELKVGFEQQGFSNVFTYLNSGNVLFSSSIVNKVLIVKKIMMMIKSKFNLNIPVFVMTVEELTEILNMAPDWWGSNDKKIYDNIIFIIPPVTYEEVLLEIGKAKEEYEKISNYKNSIFWSFDLKNYSKTNWIKTASSKINDNVTIRTANTIRKILEISKR